VDKEQKHTGQGEDCEQDNPAKGSSKWKTVTGSGVSSAVKLE